MRSDEIFVIKGNMANKFQPISDNAKLKNITEMSIAKKLVDFWVYRSIRLVILVESYEVSIGL